VSLLVLFLASLAPPDPAVLVRQLGDSSFEVRDAAEAELAGLGLAAVPALEAGLKDADVEVRVRCDRLLTLARVLDRKARVKAFLDGGDLPCWERYQAVVGTAATRKAYATVYEANAHLLDLAGKDPKQAAARLGERAGELGPMLLQPQRDKDALAALPAVLLVAGDPAVPVEPAVLTTLYAGVGILARREAVRKEFLDDPAASPLLVPVLRRGGEAAHATTLPLAGDLGLKSLRDWAVTAATTATTPTATRALCVLFIAKLGDPKDADALGPILADKAAVGTVTVGGQKLTAELGDVALAAVIHLKGESPADYGFPYWQAVPGLKTLPSPERLGFADAAGRDAAFKKWREKK